jgi:hypothetical protein
VFFVALVLLLERRVKGTFDSHTPSVEMISLEAWTELRRSWHNFVIIE